MKLSKLEKGGVVTSLGVGVALCASNVIQFCRFHGCDNEFQNGYVMQGIAFSIPICLVLALLGYLCAMGIEWLLRRR